MSVVRSMLELRARDGAADDLLAAFERLEVLERSSAVPGFGGAELLRDGDEPDVVIVTSRWRDADAYARWRTSPDAAELGALLAPYVADAGTPRVLALVQAVAP